MSKADQLFAEQRVYVRSKVNLPQLIEFRSVRALANTGYTSLRNALFWFVVFQHIYNGFKVVSTFRRRPVDG